MTRRVWMLLIMVAGVAGCTPTYRVHVNTFSELKEPLTRGTAIYVAVDPNSPNPILAERMAAEIRTILQNLGYGAAEEPKAARYTLTFRTGVNSSSYVDYLPVARPFGGFYGRYGGFYRGFGFGYNSYVPYVETAYTHWLEERLYGQDDILKGKNQPLWIGEAAVGTDEPELRRAVNYLLVGLMDYLGTETEHWVTVKLKADDPRVLALAEGP
jgi:hypothetical protein